MIGGEKMRENKVYAYYFPNWHVEKRNEEWHGSGWTEWNVTKCAMPKFEGHYQPKKPLWGYADESDPKVMELKIAQAVKHHVNGFIFDWYWVDGKPYRNRCIEEGFLKADNCNDLEFALMLCNHEPIQAHPTPRIPRSKVLGECTITPEKFEEITQYCIEHYFRKENYIRVDGALLFSVFNIAKFINDMGGIDIAVNAIKKFRDSVREAGLGEVHFSSIDSQACILNDMFVNKKKELNFDAIGAQGSAISELINDYDVLNFTANLLKLDSWCSHISLNMRKGQGFPAIEFADCVEDYEEICQGKNDAYNIPYNPCVTLGWDSSPRTVQSEVYEDIGYPFTRIVKGNTPDAIKEVFVKAKKIMERDNSTAKFLTIHSWNEWTEGAYLEPDEKYGYSVLEAVREVFDK